MVKIAVLAADGGGRSGTGFIIDRQGYVLTSFRTIGHGDGASGTVGSLYAPDNRYLVATQEGSEARYRYVARVVRADVRKDVAVLQIVARLGGGSLRGVDFPTLAEGPTPARGSRGRIIGYPSGSSTQRAVSATVRGVVLDSYRQPAYIETQARLDAGMVGGPLLDTGGRFSGVTITSAGLVRPGRFVSARWRDALRAGNVNDLRVEGMRTLALGAPLPDATFAPPRQGSEWLYYRLPTSRPLNVRVEPALGLGVYARGRAYGSGRGSVAVEAGTPGNAVLAVEKPASCSGLSALRGGRDGRGHAVEQRPWKSQRIVDPGRGLRIRAPTRGDDDATGGDNGRCPKRRPGAKWQRHRQPPGRGFGALLSRFLTGMIGERSFRRELLGSATTARGGRFEIRDLAPGRRYSVAGFAPGYRPVVLAVSTPTGGGTTQVPTLRMTR